MPQNSNVPRKQGGLTGIILKYNANELPLYHQNLKIATSNLAALVFKCLHSFLYRSRSTWQSVMVDGGAYSDSTGVITPKDGITGKFTN